jgi:hypothetical protein
MVALFAVAGCVSTPAKRIQADPATFARFPPDVQAKVQKGEVEVGFTRDMVRLALGRPQRISTRTTEAGQLEIWLYMGIRHMTRYEPMDTGYWYRDRSGRLRRSYDTIWVDRGYSEEYPVMRLEFSDDKVKAIERMTR